MIDIQDYHAGGEAALQDPTATHEEVEKQFMDKLARVITHAEEALQAGTHNIDSDQFFGYRGDFLDLMEDPQMRDWLEHMRRLSRAPYRRFAVSDDPEPEPEDEDAVEA